MTLALMAGYVVLPSPVALAQAAPTYEVLITRNFDGTGRFDDDPADDGVGGHTPGLDQGSDNWVVRTFDGFGVRVDWNVNEGDVTGLYAEVTLATVPKVPADPTADEADIQWVTDGTGRVSGCLPGSSISPDGLTLTCLLGDHTQGTQGSFNPAGYLDLGEDTSEFTASVALYSDQDPAVDNVGGVANDELGQSFFVSEAPAGDWIKNVPKVSDRIVLPGGQAGYVYLFPIGLTLDALGPNPEKGSGEIPATPRIAFFDHAWDFPLNARFATTEEMGLAGFAGTNCQLYAQNGPYPGPTTGDDGIATTWNCSGRTVGDNGYLVRRIEVNHLTNTPPPNNSDGSLNAGTKDYVVAGQIAYFLPEASMQNDINGVNGRDADYSNSITDQDYTVNLADPNVDPIAIEGNDATVTDPAREDLIENNTVDFGAASSGGGTGGAGAYQRLYHYSTITNPTAWYERSFYYPDGYAERRQLGNPIEPFVADGQTLAPSPYFNGNGTVSRGYPVQLNLSVYTENTFADVNRPMHGCMVWDPEQIYLTPMDPLTTRILESGPNDPPDRIESQAPSGLLENFVIGSVSRGSPTTNPGSSIWFEDLPLDQQDFTIHIEYAYDPTAIGASTTRDVTDLSASPPVVNLNRLECNDANRTWVDSTDTAALAQYETSPGSGIYELNMVRVRMEGTIDWNGYWKNSPPPGSSVDAGFLLAVSGMIGTDLETNANNTGVYVHSARAYGPWTGGAPAPVDTCLPRANDNWTDGVLDTATPNGAENTATDWCNRIYAATDEATYGTTRTSLDLDAIDLRVDPASSGKVDADTDRVVIQQVRPDVEKFNNDGLFDVTDNDDTATYTIEVSAIGSDREALLEYIVTDTPAPEYVFESLSVPNDDAICTTPPVGTNGPIECRFTTDNGGADGLPLAIPGGWSSEFEITVRLRGGIAFDNRYRPIPNTVVVNTAGLQAWDPDTGTFLAGSVPADAPQSDSDVAYSYMPLAYDLGFVQKVVDDELGPCPTYPGGETPPDDWSERCSVIDYDSDDSNVDVVDVDSDTDTSNGNMTFQLSYLNDGSSVLRDMTIIDVLPYNGDATEPDSFTDEQDPAVNDQTDGDGRTPPTDIGADSLLGFVSGTINDEPADFLFSADDPATISRDPLAANYVPTGAGDTTPAGSTWCDGFGAGATVVIDNGGECPTNAYEVTAVQTTVAEINPDDTVTLDLTLDTERAECDDIWTNTFGARVAFSNVMLPVRSNDVSIMVACEFDLALRKTIDSDWVPGAADPAPWLTPGTSTVDFLVEVINQADPVNDFDVTDYIDTDRFEFLAADNGDGATLTTLDDDTTTDDVQLPFTWTTDANGNPVAQVDGALGAEERVLIPVRLRVLDPYPGGDFVNFAEISYFDWDGDRDNGTAINGVEIVDIDSTPDNIDGNGSEGGPDGETVGGALVDDAVDENGKAGGDEDDHDLAVLPVYDLALRKTLRDDPAVNTAVSPFEATFDITVFNQGTAPAYSINVTDYLPTGMAFDQASTTALWTTETVTGVSVADAAPTFLIDGPLAPDASFTFPIVVDITDPTASPFINAAEISSFDDDDDPTNPENPLAVDIDSTPDDEDESNGGETIGDALVDDEIDESGTLGGDEDDHDIAELVLYDLALRKRIVANDELADGIQNGDKITFEIEVFNQGATIEDFSVTDYVADSWEFVANDNPDPATPILTSAGDEVTYSWTGSDPAAPVVEVDGVLAAGASVVIPVVLTVDITAVPGNLVNYAEILSFDNDGNPDNGDSTTDPNIFDVDSTPDGDNNEPADGNLQDDVIDESTEIDTDGNGVFDEDDHDIAMTQWFDAELIKETATYQVDTSVTPVEVSYDITVNNQGPNELLDVQVTDTPPVGFTFDSLAGPPAVSGSDGTYTIDSIPAGEQVTFTVTFTVDLAVAEHRSINTAEVSEMFAEYDPDGDGGPLEFGLYPAADIDSTPDTDPNNDVIVAGDPAEDNVDDVDDSHNTVNYLPDGETNLHLQFDDEDDHDTEIVLLPLDLALIKTFVSATQPLVPNGQVEMLITIVNQGAPVQTVEVTDYLDPALWQGFDPALNPDGIAGGDAGAFSYVWDGTDEFNPVVTFTADTAAETFAFGESLTVPIVVTVSDDFVSTNPLINIAEISNFDTNLDPDDGDAADGTLVDIDSTPDNDDESNAGETIGDTLVDNAVDEDGKAGDDEDDHDPVVIPIFDLALRKTLVTEPTAIRYGGEVTFNIEVFNQGTVDATNVQLIDYVDTTVWEAFSAADNGTGTTTGDVALPYSWSAAGTDGVVTLIGTIPAGESAIVPVTLTLRTDANPALLENYAEITGGTPTVNGETVTYPDTDEPLQDIDSTPDTDNNEPDDGLLVDDVIDNSDGDEDDHDIAAVELYDLALRKQLDPTDPDLLDGVKFGDKLTFNIEVFNQGADVEDFDVTDYLDAGWAFAAADNPAGTTTGDQALAYEWDGSDPNAPVATVTGVLPAGESVVIPIVLIMDVSSADDSLDNFAEISRFDNDGNPDNGDSSDGTIVDIDSTPDNVNNEPGDDVLEDDVINENDAVGDLSDDGVIDEDDHDVALVPWFDLALIKSSGTYVVDVTALPVTVTWDLTVKNQGPNAVADVSVLDSPPAGFTYDSFDGPATVSEAGPNEFTISSLDAGDEVTFTVTHTVDMAAIVNPSVNTAEISAMFADYDPDGPAGPLEPGRYPAVDVDSTPDDDPNNDVVSVGDPANPGDGVDIDAPEDSNNAIDFDGDDDGNLHNPNDVDEDDHDTEAVYFPYDLALIKTLVTADQPMLPDGQVTMLISVVNQGAPVANFDVTDYLDPSMWVGFDPALNPDGAAGGDAGAFTYTWDGSDILNPVASVVGTDGELFTLGETVTIPITVVVNNDFDTSVPLVNIAEISNFDSNNNPDDGDAADGTLVDIDSTPDNQDESNAGETIGDALIDDDLTGNGKDGGDEDDHDPVFIPVYDLALRKTVDFDNTTLPVSFGEQVTFLIEVINQGTVDATDVSLIDYVDLDNWEAFDPALNPTGTTTGDAELTYVWSADGTDGAVQLSGTLTPGQTVFVPVTLTINDTADLANLLNYAEITGGTPTDGGETVTDPTTGEPIVDVDSTPDDDNNEPDDDRLVDDVVDNTDGDEDDHDVAVVEPPTYSLGNQVWFDENDNGKLDADETPIEGVIVDLFTDADGDGLPDDLDGDGVITEADAIAQTTTDADGGYLFTDLELGDYVVGINPENFLSGGALFNMRSSTPTNTDADDGTDDDDNGFADPAGTGYVFSGPVTIDGREPVDEPGLANDPNTRDDHSDLTVDFGFWLPTLDLALRKTVDGGQSVFALGDTVTYNIEVFNQGNVTAIDIEVLDTPPEGMRIVDPDWDIAADGTATIVLPGPLAPGDSVVVQIDAVLEAANGTLINDAEITDVTPIDPTGEVITGPDGEPIDDIDSDPDRDPKNDRLVDDEIDNAGGDEDDHDIAEITVATDPVSPPTTRPNRPPGPLPFTGLNTGLQVLFSAAVVGLGALAVLATRRRRTEAGSQ